jgi:hypothetical protein
LEGAAGSFFLSKIKRGHHEAGARTSACVN